MLLANLPRCKAHLIQGDLLGQEIADRYSNAIGCCHGMEYGAYPCTPLLRTEFLALTLSKPIGGCELQQVHAPDVTDWFISALQSRCKDSYRYDWLSSTSLVASAAPTETRGDNLTAAESSSSWSTAAVPAPLPIQCMVLSFFRISRITIYYCSNNMIFF